MHRNCRRCGIRYTTYPSRCKNGNGRYCSIGCKQLDTEEKNSSDLTLEAVRELLSYDPDTGLFTWRHNRFRRFKGMIAGHIHHKGYRHIEINGRYYAAHRLVWFYWHGIWPDSNLQIDHINGVRDDNRIANLRLATQAQNQANRRAPANRTSGIKGVGVKRNGLIFARISQNNRQRHLGVYKTVEEAKAAYDAEAERLRGEFARKD